MGGKVQPMAQMPFGVLVAAAKSLRRAACTLPRNIFANSAFGSAHPPTFVQRNMHGLEEKRTRNHWQYAAYPTQ
jgi:hypothetical protein